MYHIIAIETRCIEDLIVGHWEAYVRRHFPAIRKPQLVAVRNFARHNGPDDDWRKLDTFSRGPECVSRVHTAYRNGFVQLRVKLLDTWA